MSRPDEQGGDPPAADDFHLVPGELRLAAGILLLQALGLAVVAVVLVVKTFIGHAESLGGVLITVILVLGGGALLVLAARGILAARPAFRAPLIVIELLALPVGYSLLMAGYSPYAIPLLLSALAVLYLLLTPAARETLQRPM